LARELHCRSVGRSVSQSVSQSVIQSVSQSVIRLFNLPNRLLANEFGG